MVDHNPNLRLGLMPNSRVVLAKSRAVAFVFIAHALLLVGLAQSKYAVEALPKLTRVSMLQDFERPKPIEPRPTPPPQKQRQPTPVPAVVVPPAPQAAVVAAVATPLLPSPAAAAAAAPTLTPPAPAALRVELPSSDAAYLANPSPVYPKLSKRLNEQGKVLLRVLVSSDGIAEKVELKASSGFERLDAAALRAVAEWKFVPGKRGGVAEPMWFMVPVNFELG
jgi:periplasmic protein TonB